MLFLSIVKIKFYYDRYIWQDLPLYLAENSPFYRYIWQGIPLYLAENTVIFGRVFSRKNREGDLMRSL